MNCIVLWDATVDVADFIGSEVVENKEFLGCCCRSAHGTVVEIIVSVTLAVLKIS